jgi:Uma2 family endonuclease
MATMTRHIGLADHGQTMAFEDFIQSDFEEGWLYELARGVIDVTDVPDLPHGRIVQRLSKLIAVYVRENRGVVNYWASGGSCRLRLPGMQSDRHPDQAVYLTPPPGGGEIWSRWVPDLVVEVVSRSGERRDYVEKREEYLLAGVREYWILDPTKRRFLVLERRGDVWSELSVREDETYRTRLLPGLEVTRRELLGTRKQRGH